MVRLMRLAAGLCCVALGLAGVVLPLLPTTPFMLLALWFFAGASPRLHAWLLGHPRFGPGLHAWQRHGAIGRRAKVWAMIALAATFATSLALGLGPTVLWVQAVVLPLCALFILTRPDTPLSDTPVPETAAPAPLTVAAAPPGPVSSRR